MNRMNKALIVLCIGAALPLAAQVAPEATGPPTIPITGNLSYAARYSQTDQSYPGGIGGQVAILSGDFSYSTNNERKPFSVTFGGGDSWVITGAPYNSGPYENLTLSQGLAGQHWSIQLSDNISYRQGAPEAGTGDTISGTISTTPPAEQTILTLNDSVVNNMVNASYSYKLSGFSTVNAGGGYSLIRYPNGNGIDIDSVMADMGWTQRLNARNTVVGQYAYSHYTYPGTTSSFDLNTPTIQWQRKWTRTINSNISVGPQWLTSSGTSQSASGQAQSSTGISIDSSIADDTRFGGMTLVYSHGANGGGGYLYGGKMDSVVGSFNHEFGRRIGSQLTLEFTGGYRRTSSLISPASTSGGTGTGIGAFAGNITSEYGAVQATRSLGRNFSVNASFTATEQSYLTQSAPATGNALNGLWRVIGFGFGYTPQPLHLRH